LLQSLTEHFSAGFSAASEGIKEKLRLSKIIIGDRMYLRMISSLMGEEEGKKKLLSSKSITLKTALRYITWGPKIVSDGWHEGLL